jgi:D-alanine-D-alanine ligase
VATDIQTTLQEIGFENVFLMPDDMTMIDALQKQSIHLAWLNTGGVQGENSVCHAAAVLEMLGIPYVGHNPLNGSILDEKDVFKRHLQSMGIPTSPFVTWLPANTRTLHWRMEKAFGDFSGPFIVKPVSGRASLHVHYVERAERIPALAEKIYATTRKAVLIEKYLSGREFCVAVCGGVTRRHGHFHQSAQPFAFSTLERHFEPGETIFTSMDKKAISEDRASLLAPDEAELRFELMDLARRIYREFDLKSLVRIDIRADEQGRLHVLEANPKPDLKRPTEGRTSLVSMGLKEYSMDYKDLIFGLLADRVDDLLTCNPTKIQHILPLVSA